MPRLCPDKVPAMPNCMFSLSMCHNLAVLSIEPVTQSLSFSLTSTQVMSLLCASKVASAVNLMNLNHQNYNSSLDIITFVLNPHFSSTTAPNSTTSTLNRLKP